MDYYDELEALFEGEDSQLFRPQAKRHVTTADERLVEKFNEITNFAKKHDRMPGPAADDMREASLGHRLNSIRSNPEQTKKLEEYDELGLLAFDTAPTSLDELFADDSGLFNSTEGVLSDGPAKVLSSTKPRPVEERAERKPVKDFDEFRPGFIEQQSLLASGEREISRYLGVDDLELGSYYIHEGIMLQIVGQTEKKRIYDRNKERFRVIYENGTESNMYRRSLSQRLREGGYKIVNSKNIDKDESDAVGYIYILKSLSDDQKIQTIKDLYKIGVTTGAVTDRIKNAANDPTYLMAPVKVVESYKLTGDYNPQKVEALIHRFFAAVNVDMEIANKIGSIYSPEEWFSVPISSIIEAIELIYTGEITRYIYNQTTQTIEPEVKKL